MIITMSLAIVAMDTEKLLVLHAMVEKKQVANPVMEQEKPQSG